MIKMRELGKALRKSALLLAGVLFTTAVQPAMWANAAQAVEDCVLFACGDGDSIYVDAGHINMNGDIVTNGKFTTTLENPGINGTIYENQQNSMPDYEGAIQKQYYSGEIKKVESDYSPEDVNENISTAMQVEGAFISSGNNVAINGGALMTKGDVTIDGGSFSCSNGVIYSKEGNIHIATDNFSASALFYAPNGKIYIECGNINMNGCVVAQSIEIVSSGGANLNKNQDLMKKFGQTIQADEALNDTEENNYVERREPEASQQQNNGSENAQTVIAEPQYEDKNVPQSTDDKANQQGASQETTQQTIQETPSETGNVPQKESNVTVENVAEDTMQFRDVSKQELKNPIDFFILIYQILTGQKGVLIFDID